MQNVRGALETNNNETVAACDYAAFMADIDLNNLFGGI